MQRFWKNYSKCNGFGRNSFGKLFKMQRFWKNFSKCNVFGKTFQNATVLEEIFKMQ